MKKLSVICSGILVLLLTILLFSCSKKDQYNYFLVEVDSIHVGNVLVANTPFDINFYGTIGDNGCYSFSEFKVSQTGSDINIEAWGKLNTGSGACPTVMVPLYGNKIICTINAAGTYMLKVKQPDNSYLQKEIIIR
ncbi:MAG: hypothetical protein U0X39_11780 [Bacteroidales bacterium]